MRDIGSDGGVESSVWLKCAGHSSPDLFAFNYSPELGFLGGPNLVTLSGYKAIKRFFRTPLDEGSRKKNSKVYTVLHLKWKMCLNTL